MPLEVATGASPVAWLVVPAAGFTFTVGTPAHFKSSPNVERTFCGTCGTALTYQDTTTPESIDITACSLDRPELFAPTREVWVAYRLPWVPALPALAQFGEDRSSRGVSNAAI